MSGPIQLFATTLIHNPTPKASGIFADELRVGNMASLDIMARAGLAGLQVK
jgi:hypothetical protein